MKPLLFIQCAANLVIALILWRRLRQVNRATKEQPKIEAPPLAFQFHLLEREDPIQSLIEDYPNASLPEGVPRVVNVERTIVLLPLDIIEAAIRHPASHQVELKRIIINTPPSWLALPKTKEHSQ